RPLLAEFDGVGVASSSQVNIGFPVLGLCEPGCGKQSVRSHHGRILLLNCIGVLSENADTSFISFVRCASDYWQASQVGSSTPQNLMSVAGTDCACASICARAAAAAASSADTPPAPDAAPMPLVLLPFDTAFRRPDCTVDFSADVALLVRR